MDRSSRTRCRNTSNNMGQDARLIAWGESNGSFFVGKLNKLK
jgi:hypothetical protein